ncbi:MAG: molybdopterin-dependent oxidoreductase [Coriobacteriaceae bacterium]|nr:molybdopterin-dependent oxidoreductase [Coriobacteriaceae bacterium]
MSSLTMTRRGLLKAAAVGGAALAIQPALTSKVFAEEGDAPLPGGGEVKHIRSHCRACGKMECPNIVTVRDGRVIDIVGDETGVTNRGSLCSKGKSAPQALYHPDRVKYPVKRTNPKGEDPGWVRITWDEAITSAAENIAKVQEKYGKASVMTLHGTSRITSYGSMMLGLVIGSPNTGTTAGQVCKGPRVLSAGTLAFPGAHWVNMNDGVKCFFQWGSNTEVSNYDNACRVTVDAQVAAESSVCVGPRLQNLGKEADVWVNVRPGCDDMVAAGILNIIVNEMKTYDELFVKKWTNAPFIYVEDLFDEHPQPYAGAKFDLRDPNPADIDFDFMWEMEFTLGAYPIGIKTKLLKESDLVEGGDPKKFMVYDSVSNKLVYWDSGECLWEGETEPVYPDRDKAVWAGEYGRALLAEDPGFGHINIDPSLEVPGDFEIKLLDGRTVKGVTVWQKFAEHVGEWTEEKVTELCWLKPGTLRAAAEAYGKETRQGGIQYNLAIEHSANAVQTAKLILLISTIMGNLDGVGGNRGGEALDNVNNTWIPYIVPFAVASQQTSKLPPWEMEKIAGFEKFRMLPYFWNFAGAAMFYDLSTAMDHILTGDPYPIRACVSCTGSHFHASNATKNWEAYKTLDYYWAAELWFSPTVELADIVVPTKHFLELGAMRLTQGAECGFGAQVQCVEPLAEARWDSEAIVKITEKMGLPWWPSKAEEAPPFWPPEWLDTQWPDEKQMQELTVLPSKLGFASPGPTGEILRVDGWDDFVEQYQTHGQWDLRDVSPMGYYYRQMWGWFRPDHKLGYPTPSGKVEIYSLLFESRYPERENYLVPGGDPLPNEALPIVREPIESPYSTPELLDEYPIVLTSGRRIPAYFHNEHRQLPFTREQVPVPTFQVNPATAAKYGFKHGDWCWIESRRGRVRMVADLFHGIRPDVIECDHAWWFPELPAPNHGWDLSNVNVLVDEYNQDPICGSTCLRGYLVKVYKAPEGGPEGIIDSPKHPKLKEWMPVYEGEEQS